MFVFYLIIEDSVNHYEYCQYKMCIRDRAKRSSPTVVRDIDK